MNNTILLKKLGKVWFLRDGKIDGKDYIELFNIKKLLTDHPQLMYGNFFHSSRIIEDKLTSTEPDHRIPINIYSLDKLHVTDAFADGHQKAQAFCRKVNELRFDSLIMKDTTGLKGKASFHYHCTNLAVAIGAYKQDPDTSEPDWNFALKSKLSPISAVNQMILAINDLG